MLVAAGCADATAPSGAPGVGGDIGRRAVAGRAARADRPRVHQPIPSTSSAPEAACELSQQPGPGDAPEAGGETDTSDMGGGRWRVCLEAPLTRGGRGVGVVPLGRGADAP